MTEKEKLAIKGLKEITPILKSLSDEEVFKDFKTEIEIFIICYKNFEEKIADLKEEVNKIAFENGELKEQIKKMKSDLLELKSDSFDAGMFLRVDELVQKWEIKEND